MWVGVILVKTSTRAFRCRPEQRGSVSGDLKKKLAEQASSRTSTRSRVECGAMGSEGWRDCCMAPNFAARWPCFKKFRNLALIKIRCPKRKADALWTKSAPASRAGAAACPAPGRGAPPAPGWPHPSATTSVSDGCICNLPFFSPLPFGYAPIPIVHAQIIVNPPPPPAPWSTAPSVMHPPILWKIQRNIDFWPKMP